jgi:hypothetical protein
MTQRGIKFRLGLIALLLGTLTLLSDPMVPRAKAGANPDGPNPSCPAGTKLYCAWLGDGGPWLCKCL